MSWKDRMYAGVGEHLRSIGVDAVTVEDFEERVDCVIDQGGCDVDFALDITYLDSKNKRKVYGYDGSFTDFVRGVT